MNQSPPGRCKVHKSKNAFRYTIPFLVLGTMLAFAAVAVGQLPIHEFNPNNPNNPYGLTNLDPAYFDGAYGYCRWGNPLKMHISGNYARMTPLLTAQLPDAQSDLFLNNQGNSALSIIPFPASTYYNGEIIDLFHGILFPPEHPNYAIFRKFHFRNSLIDVTSGQPLDSATKKLVVVIHGWNRESVPLPYEGREFTELEFALKSRLTPSTGWKLVFYDWKEDADTGGLLVDTLIPPTPNPVNPTEAAVIGHWHGQHLGELLVKTANLEKVHFIVHSAGTWVARAATRYLLQYASAKVQITLLDPFVPGVMGSNNTPLNNAAIDELAVMDSITSGKVYLLENYFAIDDDVLAYAANEDGWAAGSDVRYRATSQSFNWGSRGIKQRVDWNPGGAGAYYDWHSGPIQFYARTIVYSDAVSPSGIGDDLKNPEFDLNVIGWHRSMFYCEPFFALQPQSETVNVGQTAHFSINPAIRGTPNQTPSGLTIQWQVKTASSGWSNTGTGATTLNVSNVTSSFNGNLYRAIGTFGGQSETSLSATLTVNGISAIAPTAPTNLVARAISSTQINLTWIDNSLDETSFTVERSTASGSWTDVVTMGRNISAYSDASGH